MRLSFDSSPLRLAAGDRVRVEVVESDEKGSDILLNGVPARVAQKLEAGKTIEGHVEKAADGRDLVVFQGDAQAKGETSGFLTSIGMSENAESMALLQNLQKNGVQINSEAFHRAWEIMLKLGIKADDKLSLNALALLMRLNMPESSYELVKKYVKGELNFENLFKNLNFQEQESMKASWKAGKLLDRIFASLSNENQEKMSEKLDISKTLSENLLFQELLSQSARANEEGRLYFQWPVFWADRDLPDTLEGEAFVPPKGREDQGYSLRILVKPPKLGPLEVSFHQLKSNLWIHFAAASGETRTALKSLFPALQKRLKELSWSSVKFTVGVLPARSVFLGAAESSMGFEKADSELIQPRSPVDIKI